jgi:predicted pyridoxine 5'-phosphate oxidase superfamily flavin-nucleotide-binding protein
LPEYPRINDLGAPVAITASGHYHFNHTLCEFIHTQTRCELVKSLPVDDPSPTSPSWNTLITEDLAAFIALQTSVSIATATASGQPYIQFRNGPAGFLQVLDDKRLAVSVFADDSQFITIGNLLENPKAHLLLTDPAMRNRVSIWGEARLFDKEDAPAGQLKRRDTRTRIEKMLVFTVSAWDASWPQASAGSFNAAGTGSAPSEQVQRLETLRAEIARLREPHQPK